MIKAVIFDFDKTIFDIRARWVEFREHICREYLGGKGLDGTLYDFYINFANKWRHELPEDVRKEIMKERTEMELEGIEKGESMPTQGRPYWAWPGSTPWDLSPPTPRPPWRRGWRRWG